MSTDDIVSAFLSSGYDSGRYSRWPLDRQLCVFLSAHRATAWVVTDDATYHAVYAGILARRRNGSGEATRHKQVRQRPTELGSVPRNRRRGSVAE